MRTLQSILCLVAILYSTDLSAQTVVKMDMPQQADQPLKVVALFEEEIPEGIPVVLGLMGYDVDGGTTPYLFEWLLNGTVVSTKDIVIFTPNKGDDLSLKVTDNNLCRATTAFNLKVASIPVIPEDGENDKIEIYPTLVTHNIHIKIPRADNPKALLRIFDVRGVIAHQEYLLESTNVNINLAPGTYFVSVRMGLLHKMDKIIVR